MDAPFFYWLLAVVALAAKAWQLYKQGRGRGYI
jgi:hypothetical protein